MQFYKTARDLRRDITKMLELMFYDESKFCYSRGLEYYLQTRMLEVLGKLMEAITRANEIYPTTEEELTKRRLLQNDAIGYASLVENELEYLVDLFPKKIRKLRKFKKMGKTLEEAKELYIPWRIDWIKKGGNPIPSDIAFVNIFARRPA